MISKTRLKQIRLLHQKKQRDLEGLFIAEGPKVVEELLNSGFPVKELFATSEFKTDNLKCPVQLVSQKELESISALATPNQVLGVFGAVLLQPDPETMKQELVLALDDIRDPGNLGSIIRIADWFGIHHILCSTSCVEVFNPKVVQASMGSMARVCMYYVDLEHMLKKFDPVYAAVLDGKNIYSEPLTPAGVILIGNESQGISTGAMKHVTRILTIPRLSQAADSLNAAVATAVICSEFRRR